MNRSVPVCLWALLCLLPASLAAQTPALTVVSAGPQGEVANRDEAKEIRIIFSEPMLALGRIPATVTAPFVKITPAIPGAFRWSGSTILVFTPDAKRPPPFATAYQVTVTTEAQAVSGRRLAKPYVFRFTTPTVKLLDTRSYRRGGLASGNLVVLLRFNQPVRPADIARSVSAALEPHAWPEPAFTAEEVARLRRIDPASLDRFNAKVAATRAVASSTSPVTVRLTTDWDRKSFPAAPELVAFEAAAVAPESWVKVNIAPDVRSTGGTATPGAPQTYTIQTDPAFLITGFECRSACDGDVRNPIKLRSEVKVRDFQAAVSATDITMGELAVAKAAKPRERRDYEGDRGSYLTLEDAGYDAQPPNRKYAVTANPSLKSADGQTLGYTWIGIVENWHMRAFTSFGNGHGVWEKSGGTALPFYARNMRDVTQWVLPVLPSQLMPLLKTLQGKGFNQTPPGPGTPRRMGGTPDRIESHGLDVAKTLQPGGTGLVWTAIREGEPIARARRYSEREEERTRASVVQVTNLGITVKDSPQNTLVFVTRLDNGAPVANARVSIVRADNSTFWRGTTGSDGVALAPNTPLRDQDNWYEFAFVVIAEKDGDTAYVGSDWTEGISPWEFGTGVNLREAVPLLRGTVFTDRGVYRLGEEIHMKAVLRHNTPTGIRLLPAGTPVTISVRDSQNRPIEERTVRASNWSSAEWTMTLPADGALGNYSVRALLESDRPQPRPAAPGAAPRNPDEEFYAIYDRAVHGSFLVAAYKRPDFRVDVSLTGPSAIAGDPLNGVISARYLFGAAMGTRPVAWRFEKSRGYGAPSTITEKFSDDRWVFVGYSDRDEDRSEPGPIRSDQGKLAKDGTLPLKLETKRAAGVPYTYTLEGDVEDVSRQHIANRGSVLVHPAPWYIGIRRPSYFLEQKNGLKTEIIAAGLDGTLAAGVPVEVTLTQIQWISVRRAEGNGFYTWDTERKEVPSGRWTVTTAGEPVALDVPFKSGGYFTLEARGRAADGRFAVTRTSFYVLGAGYTAWERFDHNRIELVPERRTYKPGDTARIMIQSPWEKATALVTTEREGIRSHRQFTLTSTQESISIPVADGDIPNLFVSVLLVKGRSEAAATSPGEGDASDPGKPAFRLGYVELRVEDRSKRLSLTVTANKQEYRPASTANVVLDVRDQQGRGTASEVTLWAVDYGVLSLTSYQTPDILSSVYVRKALQVINADSRQRIVSRRVLTPKGDTEGGGGGADAGAGTLRKDFRVLAFWLGSVATGADGRATVDVKLPESLTTYRIMAVAADRSSRFGSGAVEVRTNKPLTLKPTFPRFLAVGDRAHFGAVVGSQLPAAGSAVVTMKSLDPGVVEFSGASEQTVTVGAGGSLEVRFEASARSVGRARVRMTVKLGQETDAFEDVIPVEVLVSPETVAAYGEVTGAATNASETLVVPAGVVPGSGGLHVEMASTAMVGLGEGARYLVEYPYGCAEQKGSRALALLLAADLGDAFSLPGMEPAKMRAAVQQALKELEQFQCGSGGMAYWPGKCDTVSPYLTAYLLHVFKVAADLKYDVDKGMRDRAYTYLEAQLATTPPANEGWWPSYTAWQAFAVRTLIEGGRNQDSNLNRIYGYRDRMPLFALAYLHDAMTAKGETGARIADLRRRMMNGILAEGGNSHVEEINDPYLLWLWSSNARTTAMVLNSFVKASVADAPVRQMVRWLMSVRKDGRWGNTQENAHAMEALVNYYRKYEPDVPSFRAIAALGAQELMREDFKGRTSESVTKQLPMTEIIAAAPAGSSRPLTFTREGTGTLFYTTRLRYAADTLFQQGLDAGFRIERRYEPFVETGSRPAATSYKAGDLVRVVLTFRLTKERRFVAVTDPVPAGFEPVESWFATTARQLGAQQDRQVSSREDGRESVSGDSDWDSWWRTGGFDHVERHDDRVELFATRLSEGSHEFSYVVRATTAGTFRTAPAHVEEMYTPEIFGRTATTVIEVRR
jgi:alpha-2-macroglobulin